MAQRPGEYRQPIPILDPERERAAAEPTKYREYTLPPEEIERIFSKNKPPEGKRSMAQFVTNPADAKRQTEMRLKQEKQYCDTKSEEPASEYKKPGRKERPAPMEKEDLLRRVAEGETLAGIESAMGMKSNTLYYWIKKWDLIGINPGRARGILAGQNQEEELIEVTINLEQYLQERMAGKNRSEIMKEHFGKNTTAFYRALKEWKIKDPIREEAAIAEYQLTVGKIEVAATEQKAEEQPDASVAPATEAQVNAFGQLQAEIERLREELGKSRVHRDDLKAEIEKLKSQNVEVVALDGKAAEKYEATIAGLKAEIDDWNESDRGESDQLRKANEDLKAELEQLRANYADAIEQETERLRVEIARLRDVITEAVNENERLDADNRELQQEVNEKEREIAELVNGREAPKPTEGVQWFTPDLLQPEPTISISKEGVNFDPEATRQMGIRAGDELQVGIAGDRMVFRVSDSGFRLQRGTENTVRFASRMLAKWPKFQAVPKGKHLLQRDAEGLFFVEVETD